MDIRLIALDLDGTVLNSNGELDAHTCDVLCRAAQMGIVIAAATGRAFYALPDVIRRMSAFTYAITSNGTGIYRISDGDRLYTNPMSADNLDHLLPLLRDYPCPMEVFIDGIAYGDRNYVEHPLSFGISRHSADYVQATRTPHDDIPALIRQNYSRIEGMDIIVTDQLLKKEIRSKAERIPDLYVTSSVAHYLEFAAGSASKETALRFLCSSLGIASDQLMACGDGENDLEMISLAGMGIAMGNACEALKAAADYITDSNDACGVANAIEAFALSGQRPNSRAIGSTTA